MLIPRRVFADQAAFDSCLETVRTRMQRKD